MSLKPHYNPRIEDKLRLFIACVERGQTPPPWLLEFMADGAREFLIGGKPWQKGKGGRPKAGYGPQEVEAYILSYYGKLFPDEIVQVLHIDDPDGKDRGRNMRRTIDRGELAFCMSKIGQVAELSALMEQLISADYAELPKARASDCRQGIELALSQLKADSLEAGYE